MLEPWNDKSILPPPVNTAVCNRNLDLKMLKHIINNIINTLTKQSPLHNESAILSRLLYKFDKKFRNDIGYRSFKKVNCALHRYLSLNLLKDVEQFMSALPDEEDTPYYLPTKQMMQYLLVRVISFSKLMMRIVVCSKQAAVFYLDRLKRGENHWMSLMPYALLSRIWSMTFVLLQHSCSWYQQLYAYLDELQLKGLNFLPANYTLPENLGDWLDIKNIDKFGRLEWSKTNIINADQWLQDSDGDEFENFLDYVNQINENPIECQKTNQDRLKYDVPVSDMVIDQQVDQGEAISRETFTKLLNKIEDRTKSNIKIEKPDYLHVAERVTDKHALQKFIENEETFRNDGSSRSLTSHLSFMQWQSLKKCLEKLDSSTLNNRKLQRRFQKIWQEKCLDA